MNKLTSTKKSSAVFLAIVIVAGTIALSSSSLFIKEAYAQTKKIVDSDGIPLVYYDTILDGKPIGYQRNPVTTALQANEFYDKYKENNNESSKRYFLNNANWLVDNAVNKGYYSLLQYNFPWPVYKFEQPWFSAMANGLALQVLIKAHQITLDSKYLIAAKSLLKAFFIEVKDGGITYKDSADEWWYEEYATNDKNAKVSRVLNGMIFAVLGIYDYYKYTNDTDAKLLFDKGVNSIKKEISKYNNKSYSYYDIIGKPAGGKYHQIHIDLTKKLYDLTGEPIFNQYYELWKNYNSFDIDPPISEAGLCSDGIDNDGNGSIDNKDSDCSAGTVNINIDTNEFRPIIILPIP